MVAKGRTVRIARLVVSFAAATAILVWSIQFLRRLSDFDNGYAVMGAVAGAGGWLWLAAHVLATVAAWLCAVILIELVATLQRRQK